MKFRYDELNEEKYKERMKISFETFLIEADERGKTIDKKVYCHVVGLGLGVWQHGDGEHQTKLYLEAFKETLELLYRSGRLQNIGVVDFSWIGELISFTDINISSITIKFSRRNPFANDLPVNMLLLLYNLSLTVWRLFRNLTCWQLQCLHGMATPTLAMSTGKEP